MQSSGIELNGADVSPRIPGECSETRDPVPNSRSSQSAAPGSRLSLRLRPQRVEDARTRAYGIGRATMCQPRIHPARNNCAFCEIALDFTESVTMLSLSRSTLRGAPSGGVL